MKIITQKLISRKNIVSSTTRTSRLLSRTYKIYIIEKRWRSKKSKLKKSSYKKSRRRFIYIYIYKARLCAFSPAFLEIFKVRESELRLTGDELKKNNALNGEIKNKNQYIIKTLIELSTVYQNFRDRDIS